MQFIHTYIIWPIFRVGRDTVSSESLIMRRKETKKNVMEEEKGVRIRIASGACSYWEMFGRRRVTTYPL